MKTLSLNLDQELARLDPSTARQFKEAVHAMLRLVKARQPQAEREAFSNRISRHPAIGTWPETLDADQHIANLRGEWER